MKKNETEKEEAVDVGRRTLFKAAGLVAASAAVSSTVATSSAVADIPPHHDMKATQYVFLHPAEVTFLTAATARLIPSDANTPGALEADVTNFIDKALASPWGGGSDMYVSGPWKPGTPEQGYQLKFTPSELYRTALTAINKQLAAANTPFDKMTQTQQDAYLTKLESGSVDLDGVPSAIFFSMLLQNTIEGFLADPSYGGNKDMLGWKAIGFPGAYVSWYDLADKHGINLDSRTANPISMANAPKHDMSHSGKGE
ncbi:gluconate 2-dehydrogenase subunit 3 family protein [Shewanella gaetbuli]|uniref:Gluconate 2-dehydrogenase subunit 3 family protein n=1 Tax=Shewanella gaetbuli TaxID=220752 RepID=A0A9X2CJM6_9GAMM|nr:gluconate 2-dehydrogenase subunit 3 family protein [Shewanella gaetbuli]MCL1142171.1 gluconate 2-dehydrogenase subunit 3 family protein [Shewanella gaetbuli]